MEEKKEEGKTCGTGTGGCGVRCVCCVCKCVKGALLLLVGGAIGFGMGRCGSLKMCGTGHHEMMQSEGAPAAAQVVDAKKAK